MKVIRYLKLNPTISCDIEVTNCSRPKDSEVPQLEPTLAVERPNFKPSGDQKSPRVQKPSADGAKETKNSSFDEKCPKNTN